MRKLVGWELSKNRNPIYDGKLFFTYQQAQDVVIAACSSEIVFLIKAVSPEGFAFYQGMHPKMADLEEKYPISVFLDGRQYNDYQTESNIIRESIGHDDWWNRWYIEPVFSKEK